MVCTAEPASSAGRGSTRWLFRWHNKLNPAINGEGWSAAEEQLLFQYHEQYGNKWARIAQHLPQRYYEG